MREAATKSECRGGVEDSLVWQLSKRFASDGSNGSDVDETDSDVDGRGGASAGKRGHHDAAPMSRALEAGVIVDDVARFEVIPQIGMGAEIVASTDARDRVLFPGNFLSILRCNSSLSASTVFRYRSFILGNGSDVKLADSGSDSRS